MKASCLFEEYQTSNWNVANNIYVIGNIPVYTYTFIQLYIYVFPSFNKMTVQSHGFSSYLLIYFSAQNFILNIFFSVSPLIFYYESVFMHWNCRDRMYGSWVWLDCKFKTSATTCIPLPLPSVLQAYMRH